MRKSLLSWVMHHALLYNSALAPLKVINKEALPALQNSSVYIRSGMLSCGHKYAIVLWYIHIPLHPPPAGRQHEPEPGTLLHGWGDPAGGSPAATYCVNLFHEWGWSEVASTPQPLAPARTYTSNNSARMRVIRKSLLTIAFLILQYFFLCSNASGAVINTQIIDAFFEAWNVDRSNSLKAGLAKADFSGCVEELNIQWRFRSDY